MGVFFVFEGLLRCSSRIHAFLPSLAVMRAMRFLYMNFAAYSVYEMAVLYYRAGEWLIYIYGFASLAAYTAYNVQMAMYRWRRTRRAIYGTGAEPGRYTEVFDVTNIYM